MVRYDCYPAVTFIIYSHVRKCKILSRHHRLSFVLGIGFSDTSFNVLCCLFKAYVQCHDDIVEKEMQTEEIEMSTKWTQNPPDDFKGCGGRFIFYFNVSKKFQSILINFKISDLTEAVIFSKPQERKR